MDVRKLFIAVSTPDEIKKQVYKGELTVDSEVVEALQGEKMNALHMMVDLAVYNMCNRFGLRCRRFGIGRNSTVGKNIKVDEHYAMDLAFRDAVLFCDTNLENAYLTAKPMLEPETKTCVEKYIEKIKVQREL